MKNRLKKGTKQLDIRSASRYQGKQSSGAGFVDKRCSSALQNRVMQGIHNSPMMTLQCKQFEHSFGHPIQRAAIEEEELLQGKFSTLQRQPVEDELLQGKFNTLQRQAGMEEEELLQGRFSQSAQLEQENTAVSNQTGIPENLKHGIESLSGMDLSDVRVHYNSSRPAQLNALAYAQGNDIHLGSGQEKHLSHEAWHTVQQRQGRVQPTMQMGGENINADAGLEQEADRMGEKALRYKKT